jgi:hypothetical protein
MTHLRKIMLEELQRRHYSEATTRYYIRAVERFIQRVRANLRPEPLAERRRGALGRKLPTRTARPCHSAERATSEATPLRLPLLLPR